MQSLIKWSEGEFNWLPWRKNRTLYRTLVSEIMLQQTTVSTVLKHFERFIEEYPDTHSLANSTEEQLTISWKGLGYYRRARNLKKACTYFVENHNGEIPLNYDELIKAPGVGEYTANAILAIGSDIPALALDANLERVISRVYGIDTVKGPKLLKRIQELFTNKDICQEIYKVGARNYNEALMDLGRNYCKANKASCDLCPISNNCFAFKNNKALDLPVKGEDKKTQSFNLTLLRVIAQKENKILAYKKSSKEWLSGQYEVPTFILESEDAKLSQYPKIDFKEHDYLPEYKTLITKYKITNKVIYVNERDLKRLNVNLNEYEWKDIQEKGSNLSTATIKALKL